MPIKRKSKCIIILYLTSRYLLMHETIHFKVYPHVLCIDSKVTSWIVIGNFVYIRCKSTLSFWTPSIRLHRSYFVFRDFRASPIHLKCAATVFDYDTDSHPSSLRIPFVFFIPQLQIDATIYDPAIKTLKYANICRPYNFKLYTSILSLSY